MLVFAWLQAASLAEPLVTSSVYVVNEDGSNKMKIRGTFSTAGTWSPDGSMVAFTYSKKLGDKEAIYTANVSGSNRKRITKKKSTIIGSLSWTAAGNQIAYSYSVKGESDNLAVVGVDGKGLKRLIGKSSKLINNVAWSPSGNQIAFTYCQNSCDLYSIDSNGSGKKRIAKKASIDSLAWSADGEQIAFVDYVSIDAKSTTVSVVNKDGSGKRQLVKLPKKARPSRFLRLDITDDYKKIVFAIQKYSKGLYVGYDIYTMNVDGSGQKRIVKIRKGERLFNVKWSPDGKKILYDSMFAFGF